MGSLGYTELLLFFFFSQFLAVGSWYERCLRMTQEKSRKQKNQNKDQLFGLNYCF